MQTAEPTELFDLRMTEEAHQLLDSAAMVTYAWNQAISAGIPPAERNAAEEARSVLRAHHRNLDRP